MLCLNWFKYSFEITFPKRFYALMMEFLKLQPIFFRIYQQAHFMLFLAWIWLNDADSILNASVIGWKKAGEGQFQRNNWILFCNKKIFFLHLQSFEKKVRRDAWVAERNSLLNCRTGKPVPRVRIPLSPPLDWATKSYFFAW